MDRITSLVPKPKKNFMQSTLHAVSGLGQWGGEVESTFIKSTENIKTLLASTTPYSPSGFIFVVPTSRVISGISPGEGEHSVFPPTGNQVAADILVVKPQGNKGIVWSTLYIHEPRVHFFSRRRVDPREKAKD